MLDNCKSFKSLGIYNEGVVKLLRMTKSNIVVKELKRFDELSIACNAIAFNSVYQEVWCMSLIERPTLSLSHWKVTPSDVFM